MLIFEIFLELARDAKQRGIFEPCREHSISHASADDWLRDRAWYKAVQKASLAAFTKKRLALYLEYIARSEAKLNNEKTREKTKEGKLNDRKPNSW